MSEPTRRTIHIKPDSTGNVVMTFELPGGNVTATFPSAEAGNVSAEILNAAYQASVVFDDLPAADPSKIANIGIVPVETIRIDVLATFHFLAAVKEDAPSEAGHRTD